MFFCEKCRVKRDWPESLGKSRGPCEICGKTEICNDVPSSALPRTRRKEEEKADDTPASNAGSVSINTEGGVSIGIGGGLAIDPSDGSIGIQVGGVTFDTD